MNLITLKLSKESDISSINVELLPQINQKYYELDEFKIFFQNMLDDINNTILILKKIAKTKSTINISKEFAFKELKIIVIASYPEITFLTKLKKILNF